MITILTAIAACSEYGFSPILSKEEAPPVVVPEDTGEAPPVVVEEDTGTVIPPEDTYTPPQDTGGTPDTPEDTITVPKDYVVDLCANHVTPDHCPLNPDWTDIPECRAAITYDPTALDALKASSAGLTIFATMDTAPEDADDVQRSYLHISEGDNREAVMAEFAKDDTEEGGYAGKMSMHRFVDVPHVDCFSIQPLSPGEAVSFLNRRRIDLDPTVELPNNGYDYIQASLDYSWSRGDYYAAGVAGEYYSTDEGYIIYGTELMVGNNNDDLNLLVKALTADSGAVPDTYPDVSRWTAIKYVP